MAHMMWVIVGLIAQSLDNWKDKSLYEDGRFDLVFLVLSETQERPDQRTILLRALDDHFRTHDQFVEEEPRLVTSLFLWRGEQAVFVSPYLNDPPKLTPPGQFTEVPRTEGDNGQLCQTRRSVEEVVCFRSRGPGLFIRAVSGTLMDYLQVISMMMLISGPFALPALWWAIRPVGRLSRQIRERQGAALTPINALEHPRELRPLIETLNEWMTELKSTRVRERLFLANAAHELRTPLTAIQVNAEQLQRQQGADEQRLLAPLLSGCRRMSRVVEQLMRLVRHESEVMAEAEPQALDLVRVLESRMAELHGVADRKSVTLELQGTPGVVVWAPPESVESLVDNLVGNAIKYVDEGGEVLVRLTQSEHMALLEVEDNGPGIAETDRERAFQRFTRLDNPRAESGAGLGLAIVQSVTQALGGQVELRHSERLGGLHVHVELPLKPASPNGLRRT